MIQKTKPFKAVSMPCTEEQFKKQLKPILEFLGISLQKVVYDYVFVTNNLDGQKCLCGGITKERSYYYGRELCDEFCPKTFIEALGYDYNEVVFAMMPKYGINKEQAEDLVSAFSKLAETKTHYKVLRPILFFAKDNVVHKETLKKYFTKKAIKAFIKDKYIK